MICEAILNNEVTPMPQTSASSMLLVIEDNPAQLETLTDLLEAEGLHPIGCLSGADALAACVQHSVHVAILDLRLPDMDGLTVLQQLKERIPDIKVILNTAYVSLESAIAAVNRDAFAYVQKMGDPNELLAHVHRAFHAHLTDYSARLEQDVQQRTADLVQANLTLQHEIDDHKRAAAALKKSLEEKQVLLQELYHRTKNTMQVIRSMLVLQAARTPDNEGVQKLVSATEGRIMSMSLVHQKLYQSQDLSRIPLHEYISELAAQIMQSCLFAADRIALRLELEPLNILLDTAIPCGLIINELMSNAVKYAFPNERPGTITIRLFRNPATHLELHFADDGVGVPPGFDFHAQRTTLGVQTICAIAEHQMQGVIRFNTNHGVSCVIEFPDTLYQARV